MTAVAPRPAISVERYAERLAAAGRATAGRGFDALLVGVGPDLRYLTGYEALPLERLTMLLVPPGPGEPRLVAPRLELAAARAGVRPDVPIVTWEETEDPHALAATLVNDGGRPAKRVGVSDRLWAGHLLRLQAALPGVVFESATAVLRDLRMVKDPNEIELLRLAAHAADRVIAQIAAGRLVGRTEADVAREVRERLLVEGHELAEFSIVASGPNSASPHHEASDRVIRAGEPVVLDIGGSLGGYGSDITRMVWVTGGDPSKGPDPEYLRLYAVLQDAPASARTSFIGRGTESASRVTRTRIWSPATMSHFPKAPPSASSPGSTSRAVTAPGSRTSSCAARGVRSCSTRPSAIS